MNQDRRERGKLDPAMKHKRTPIWAAKAERIRAAMARTPDRTLAELRAKLGTSLTRTTLCRALRAEAFAQEKSLNAAEPARPDVPERRAAWKLRYAALDPERLVFLDETWVKTNMTRPCGRTPPGRDWCVACRTGTGRRRRSWPDYGRRASSRPWSLTAPSSTSVSSLRPTALGSDARGRRRRRVV
ncbi:MAG: hypothetical protein J0M17_06915 [Planctomycetes bacterium]|nr:hypothetical protein [Planctomycetota bacterium]